MADAAVNSEAEISTNPNQGITRRNLFKQTAGTIINAKATEVAVKTGATATAVALITGFIGDLLNRPNETQILAGAALDKKDAPKFDYKVKDNPIITQNGGLPAQVEPRVASKGDVRAFQLLKPGDVISDAIPWIGANTSNPAKQPTESWLTFKDKNGKVLFVQYSDEFIEPFVDLNKPISERRAAPVWLTKQLEQQGIRTKPKL